ncbi:hypothetical protein TRFO_29558 [Tritrichomonas foetus]|uniref:DUF3447 domain-containing protein n=1 Tax=Tritrichomonas foetus TaxID=1144522 RepID=A0A1J4JVB0_9EUKA|nr:hypothetical protein TRFO_29558 [Tritrichomonas foetus]|eukprot:OHT03095.1 hypothetical protein TRFO_29558 [Tritrichomonas foetus]
MKCTPEENDVLFLESRRDELFTIENLQNKLLELDQNFEETNENFISFLMESRFIKEKRTIRQLLFSVDCLLTYRRISFETAIFILQNEHIKKLMKENFSPNELVFIFESKLLVLHLLDNHIITIQSLMEEVCAGESYFFYFFSEIRETDFDYFTEIYSKFKKDMILPDVEKHDELRRKGINEDEYSQLIRYDKIDEFMVMFVEKGNDFNFKIPFSRYETADYVNCPDLMPNLIEYAAFFGAVNIFKFLYLEGAKFTPELLSFAVAGGNYEIIHFLEENNYKFTEDHIKVAIQFHRNEIVEYIRNNCFLIDHQSDDQNNQNDDDNDSDHNISGWNFTMVHFQQCILSCNYKYFFEMYEMFKDRLNEKVQGDSLLVDAINRGYTEVIEIFLKNPTVDINLTNIDRFTPLQMAIMNNRIDLACLFLQFPNSQENLNTSFRFSASRLCRIEFLKLLLKVPSINVNEYYAIYEFSEYYTTQKRHVTHEKNSLLSAIEYNNIEVVSLLLQDKRIDANARILYRPLNGYIKDFRYDLHNGCQMDTALIYAVKLNHYKIVELLLDCDRTDVNLINYKGDTAFHVAIKLNNINLVEMLLNCPRADLNYKNLKGNPPLHIAVMNNFSEIVELLLKSPRISKTAKNNKRKTAFDMAKIIDNQAILQLFR